MLNVDTHLHLSGCISPQFVWNVIQDRNLKFLASSYDDVVAQMTFMKGEPTSFSRFLHKFKLLDLLPWDEELIDGAIKDVCHYLTDNQIDFAFIDFTINKYMTIGWHKHEAIKFIHDSFRSHAPGKVGLVLAIKYESPRAGQELYAKLIERSDVADMLVGVDLVGDETYYDAGFYAPLLHNWRTAKKMVRAHVGESQAIDNIISAIERLSVTNVAHGFKIVNSPSLMLSIADRDISFDLCINSNYVTGVIDHIFHPIVTMHRWGIKCTLGSDDPIQFNTNLANEYKLASSFGMDDTEIMAIRENSMRMVNRFLTC